MNRILDDYLLDIRTQLLHLPYKDQDAVMAEVRAHLESDMADRRRRDPRLTPDELALQATAAFGAPDEITVRFGPTGGLVRKSTGEVLLRAAVLTGRAAKATGRAAGRGAKAVLKWTAITALIVFTAALIVGMVVLVEYKDTIAKGVQQEMGTRSIYDHDGTWAVGNPQGSIHTDSFELSQQADHMDIGVSTTPQMGCVAIQLTDPAGAIVYQNGQGCSAVGEHLSFSQHGTWKIQYTFVAYTGTISVHAIEHVALST
jgi:hypothetical protein